VSLYAGGCYPHKKGVADNGNTFLCFVQPNKEFISFITNVQMKTPAYYCWFLDAAKHSLQRTGLSVEGWKGTFASPPHCAQTVVKYSLWGFAAFFLLSRHALHLWGSFWKPFSA
jgi:hypothetical protein